MTVATMKRISTFRYLIHIAIITTLVLTTIHRLSPITKKPPSNVTTSMKYILIWNRDQWSPFRDYEGQTPFIKNNCPIKNCFVTGFRTLFHGDITKFDAILFIGRSLQGSFEMPTHRNPRQKYIFFNMESNVNFPICNKEVDGFFNWTATYKLGSDIPLPYILVRDRLGNIVAPNKNVSWLKYDKKSKGKSDNKGVNKTKFAAWFVSKCNARSNKNLIVERLQKVLKDTSFRIDTFGKCSSLKCPKDYNATEGAKECDDMLKNYYFYLALENSVTEDYVTEKVLRALQNNVVPIVYGGANYSRFLPPSSYIKIGNYTAQELVTLLLDIIANEYKYREYFTWKLYYTVHDSTENIICSFCQRLNDKSFGEFSSHQKFREWWNPNYLRLCTRMRKFRRVDDFFASIETKNLKSYDK